MVVTMGLVLPAARANQAHPVALLLSWLLGPPYPPSAAPLGLCIALSTCGRQAHQTAVH